MPELNDSEMEMLIFCWTRNENFYDLSALAEIEEHQKKSNEYEETFSELLEFVNNNISMISETLSDFETKLETFYKNHMIKIEEIIEKVLITPYDDFDMDIESLQKCLK